MKNFTIIITAMVLAASAAWAEASETTGTLTTGIQTGLSGLVIEAVKANPGAGTYSAPVDVTLSAGPGVTEIRYTTDGSTPSCQSGSVYSSPITVSSSLTITAVACYGTVASPVTSYSYTISSTTTGGGGGGGGGGGAPIVSCDADFNDDGKVDIFDLNILSNNWGSTSAGATTGDANCDGKVDIFDLNILTVNWTG